MKDNFEPSLVLVLKSEGGNVDNPKDPGGRTHEGITQRTYNAYRKRRGLPQQSDYLATEAEVADIYHSSYWEPWGDDLPLGVDYIYFDFAVNAGPHRSMMILQRALVVQADGDFGQITRMALVRARPSAVINLFSSYKESYYKSLHEKEFLQGWLNRTAAVKAAALEMANDSRPKV